ncbi:retinol dehydrogenase 12-like [Chironomus tepperi]|uniref:retinol dehydrogenase 12-like n=1 Tax=Chironomus tepperi TaxID=113505 RepID=UPI00391F36BB
MISDIIWTSLLITLLGLLSLGIFIGLILLLRNYMQGGSYNKPTMIDGKIVIITGANSGIGKETAVDLAKRGGKIYIACRNIERGQSALTEIKEKSGSDDVHFLQLDLASMKSIRKFSEDFHQLEDRLDILINNAGVMACPKSFTEDGFEMHMGTNHLGHFLLTNLLLDLLKKPAHSRIVNVASLFHIVGKISKTNFFGEKFYFRWYAYATSKLANILFTRELAKRLENTGITANSLHPGAIQSDLLRHVNIVIRVITAPFRWILFKDIPAGAQTQIRLAVDPSLENVSGKYFADCKEATPLFTARNDKMAKWLWEKSEELTGLGINDV